MKELALLIAVALTASPRAAAQLPTPLPEIAADAARTDRYPAHDATFPNGVTSIADLQVLDSRRLPAAHARSLSPASFRPAASDRISTGDTDSWRRFHGRRQAPDSSLRRLARRPGVAGGKRICRRLDQLSPQRRGPIPGTSAGRESRRPLVAAQRGQVRDRSRPRSDVGPISGRPSRESRRGQLRSGGAFADRGRTRVWPAGRHRGRPVGLCPGCSRVVRSV